MKRDIDTKGLERILSPGAAVLKDEPMSAHTTFNIGGPADCMVSVADARDIAAVAGFCRREELPLFVMGNGSNLLVSDDGVEGVVLRTFGGFDGIIIDGETVTAQSGASLSKVAAQAAGAGLTGMEFAHGIPGSIGGAVYMNAGAYGGEMKDIVESTEYLDNSGERAVIGSAEHRFSYRHSAFSEGNGIILLTTLRLRRAPKDEIYEKMDDFAKRRRDKQPLSQPSAGSVFRRPEGYFAGQLIEKSGLKGRSVGGAMVSPKHAGFIVNTGGATARDVMSLIELIKKKVYEDSGVRLKCEIKTVGRF